jgi:hypothetical protein
VKEVTRAVARAAALRRISGWACLHCNKLWLRPPPLLCPGCERVPQTIQIMPGGAPDRVCIRVAGKRRRD